MTDKNPYDTIFWNDLEGDALLKTCSLAAKGLWTCHLLPAAARSAERGVVIIGNWPCRYEVDLATVVANVAGGSPDVIKALLDELVMSGAASIDDQGRMFNRRMVKKYRESQERSKAGKKGAENRWKKTVPGDDQPKTPDGKPMAKGMANGMAKSEASEIGQPIEEKDICAPGITPDECEHDSKPMPSSSFGASKKKKKSTPSSSDAPRASRSTGEAKGTRLPVGWEPDEALKAWTRDAIAEAGLEGQIKPGRVLEEFRDHWRGVPGARGRKSDWPATWRNRIRFLIERKGKPNGSSNPKGGRRSAVSVAAAFGAALSNSGNRGPAGEGNGN